MNRKTVGGEFDLVACVSKKPYAIICAPYSNFAEECGEAA